MRVPPNQAQVAEALGYLCDNWGKDPVKETCRVRVWVDALRWSDGRLLMEAARVLAREAEYFPPVSKLLAVVMRLEHATDARTTKHEDPAQPSATCNACGANEWYDKKFVRNGEPVLNASGVQMTRVHPRHLANCKLRQDDDLLPQGSLRLHAGPM